MHPALSAARKAVATPTRWTPSLIRHGACVCACVWHGAFASNHASPARYFLRYGDAHNADDIFTQESITKWNPVHFYVGGIEHAILHLLYSRFITRFLHAEVWFVVGAPCIVSQLISMPPALEPGPRARPRAVQATADSRHGASPDH